MQVNEYQKAAMATLNPALDKKDVLINSVMGLCGESGEAIDIVKKWLMQGHELDKERLVKELGDVAWYLAEAATALDVPLEAVFQGNLDKLRQRFPNGFDTEASVNRKEGICKCRIYLPLTIYRFDRKDDHPVCDLQRKRYGQDKRTPCAELQRRRADGWQGLQAQCRA